MISNDVIQADIVAALKADPVLVAALGSEDRIKEAFYTGKEIDFPAVRVRIMRQMPISSRGVCDHANLSVSIRSFAEGGSSKKASQIAGLVVNALHGFEGGGKFFQGDGWATYFRNTGYMGPFRTGEKLWSDEATFAGVVYPA